MRARRAVTAVILALTGAGSMTAQPYAGTMFSFNRSSFIFSNEVDQNTFWEVSLGVDYGNSVLKQSRVPGVMGTYSYNFILSGKEVPSGRSCFYAGPGAALGWVRDKDDVYGLVLGVSGTLRYEFEFKSKPITVYFGITPTLGVHVCNSDNGLVLDFYDNSLTWSLGPQIGLKYNLGRGVSSTSSGADAFQKGEESAGNTTNASQGETQGAIKRPHSRFTYGVEWAYSATFINIYHHNYTSSTGRADTKDFRLMYLNNGLALAHVGVNLNRHLNLSVYGGYGSIYTEERVFPVSLRGTWLFKEKPRSYGRWFTLLDGGCALKADGGDPGIISKCGAGYRIALSRSVKLDFMLAYQFVYAQVEMTDEDGNIVSDGRIRRNDNYLNSINFTIGLTL